MNFFKKAHGILGQNARNLHYVGRYNTGESKKFADDKLYTKNYLLARGIGVAKIYFVINNYKELHTINAKTLPQSFVIKPNRGFGGEGIIVIKKHNGRKFTDVTGKEHNWKDLFFHCVAILDGKYSITGLYDQVLIEERLRRHKDLAPFTEMGLPDIRIIVFNYVPVIAMLRLPTLESKGKANLHLGAVGVGIDIATGKATYATQKGKFIRKLPNGERIKDIKLPMWDEILTMASEAQKASQIKFLAVDIALTKTGVKILELNARAGLAVQIANQIPLKHRLEKVEDLKVSNPEKGVEVSKAIFSSVSKKKDESQKKKTTSKKIIGLFETIDILSTKYTGIKAKIDPHSSKVTFDESLSNINNKKRFVDVLIRGKRVRFPYKVEKLETDEYQAIIGGKVLVDFLIDPNLKQRDNAQDEKKNPEKEKEMQSAKLVAEKIIRNIDKKLYAIDKELNILKFVKPVNYEEEKARFLQYKDFSPQFIYNKSEYDLKKYLREVASLPRDVDHPLMPLFLQKMDEIVSKIELINAIGNDEEFTQISERLYGGANKKLYLEAKDYIRSHVIQEDKSKKLGSKQIIKNLENFLKKNRLYNWKVKAPEGRTRGMGVDKKKQIIYVTSDAKYSENKLKALIAHEIGTHVYRYENGAIQDYKIFRNGTAHYIETEEGLAIYNQRALGLDLGFRNLWPAIRVVAAHEARNKGFLELFTFFQNEYHLNDTDAWRACNRAKRGMANTDSLGAFTRDIIYFKGYKSVKKFLDETEGGLKQLYTGKIGVGDVTFLQYIDVKKSKYSIDGKIDFGF